jgi:gliding motility-associated-like protein
MTVQSNKSQCITNASTTITTNATPVFTQAVSIVDQIICGPDGSVTVTQVTLKDRNGTSVNFDAASTPALLTDFQFEWTRSGDATGFLVTNGAPAIPTSPAGATLDKNTYLQTAPGQAFASAFGARPSATGTYTVVARRISGSPGANCASAPFTVTIQDKSIAPAVSLTPLANTSCNPLATQEGEIKVVVSDVTANNSAHIFTPFLYNYNWTTVVTAIGATANNDGDGYGGGEKDAGGVVDNDGDHPKALQEGTYVVSVTNPQTGCSSPGTTTIFKNSTPVFTQSVKTTDQVLCTPDGKLVVTEVKIIDRNGVNQSNLNTPPDFPLSDFWFQYDRVITGTTTNILAFQPNAYLDKTDYVTPPSQPAPAGIGFGTYYVTTKRNTGFPGNGCSSAPFKVDILDKRLFPLPSLTPLANTSCDPGFFEGEIKVSVTDASVNIPAPLTGTPFTYNYNWTTVVTGIAASAGNDGDGFGGGEKDAGGVIDNDGDHPKSLQEGTYIVDVINAVTGCTSTGSTTIFRNSTPVFTQLVVPTAQVLCSPDGKLVVKEVKIIDRNGVTQSNLNTPPDFPLTDFDFTYDRVIGGVTTNVLTHTGNAYLDKTNYLAAPGIGFGTYYVTSTRTSGFPGQKCSSAPYRVDIDDKRVYPTVEFTSVANSTCPDPITGAWTKANGGITAIAAEPNGTNTDPYTFAWTLNGTAIGLLSSPAPIENDTSPTSALTNALDGAYIVTVTNSNTGCPFAASFNLTLDQTRSTPNIIDVNTIDPIDCNPSAQAEVTKITLGSTFDSSLQPPLIPPDNTVTGALLGPPRFVYSWYEGSLSNKLSTTTLPCIGPGCTTPTAGLLSGDHFVSVTDAQTNCQSDPKQFVIKTDNVIYPVVGITQLVKQISCIPPATAGTGELQANVVEQDGSVGTSYTFAWYPSLDLTGTAYTSPYAKSTTYNPDTLRQLLPGNYSVQVKNNVTSCTAQALFIIPDESPFFLPTLSTGTAPQTFCVGVDGDAQVRILLNPDYPLLPYDNTSFTTDLYKGLTPDLTTAPDVQANIPFTITGSSNTITYDVPALATGFYTFRVIDKNTGCVSTDSVHIRLDQRKPIIATTLDSPMRNCDPAIADGQLSAIVTSTTNYNGTVINQLNNGGVQGYTFDWFAGQTATGSILQTDDKLIGQRTGKYTVRATDNVTGCYGVKTDSITDATVIPPVPTATTIQDRLSCVTPDGQVTASVGGATLGYTFNWYIGTAVTSTPDFQYPDYISLNIGSYTVTAVDQVTHCVSPPATTVVADKRVKPTFNVTSTGSYCADVGRPTGNGTFSLSATDVVTLSDITWSLAGDTTNIVAIGAFANNLFPGDYHVHVTTNEGCENSGNASIETEIKPYNLVSSNNDGQNDAFIIDCIQNFPNNNVKIFNRNGTMVYEVDGYDNLTKFFRGVGEQGVYLKDKELPEGTYFYIIDKKNGTKPQAGFIELVR